MAGTRSFIWPHAVAAARAPALEFVESFFGETEKLGLVDLQVMRVDDGIVDRLGDQLAPDVLPERRAVRPDETALPGERLDDALALQLRVRLRDRIAVDAQLLGQRADAGERIALANGAGGGRRFHLIDQLQVDGLSRT